MAPKKGEKSKTMPGEEDFTTKKTSKYFDRGGHREKNPEGSKKDSKPFEEKPKGKQGGMRKMSEKEKEWMKEIGEGKDKSQKASMRMKAMRHAEFKSKAAMKKYLM